MFDLSKVLCMDVETDGLDNYEKMHFVVCQDLETGEEHVFTDVHRDLNQRAGLSKLLVGYPTIAGHFFLNFDQKALRKLAGIDIPSHKILDTIVVSRLLNYGIPGGHSIEAWAKRLGTKKEGADITDWSQPTQLMLDRCKSDVMVLRRMIKEKFWRFLTDPQWQPSIEIEHFIARNCVIMHENGLPFDVNAAAELHKELAIRIADIDEIIQRDFPPKKELIRTVIPRLTKKGTINAQDFRWLSTRSVMDDVQDNDGRHIILGPQCDNPVPDLSSFTVGVPVHLYELVEFNPASPKQTVALLNEAGWKPTEKTKGHKKALRDKKTWPSKKDYYEEFGWTISETNLETLPESAPVATKSLAQRLILASRLSDLEEWLALVQPDGRIHPQFNSIGAWTQRMSHNTPNSANVPVGGDPDDPDNAWMSDFQKYVLVVNNRMRACFYAPPGYRQVGTDADGIQMRIFCHLVQDERLREAILTGSKSNGTDIHSLHQKFLGPVCKTRGHAKTFIYAWLLGAGIGQVAYILECAQREAKTAVDNFLESYPGLKKFKKETIPNDAARGYFVGLDGRKVACDSEHLMLAGYLQNGEKVIMSYAMREWMARADEAGIDYYLANFVHDEWQVFVRDDDETCKKFQDIQKQAFVTVGEELGLFIPLAGSSDWGYNWQETH